MSKQTHQERLAYLQSVHQDCDERWNVLKQALPPGTAMNTLEMRLNVFIIHLVEWGLISEEQKVEFEIKFAEEIQDQLITMKKDYDEQVAEAKRQANAPKLVLPNAQEVNKLKKG